MVVEPKKRKRIHNPVNKKYFSLRRKTTKKGRKGQIKSKWSSKAANS